jgi:hypothetical protein
MRNYEFGMGEKQGSISQGFEFPRRVIIGPKER